MDVSPRGFNLKENLQILFVGSDSDNDPIFYRYSRIWEILNQVEELRRPINKDNRQAFETSLKRNHFGYVFIEYTVQHAGSTDIEIQHRFTELVRRLRPQLLVVIGRSTYSLIFLGRAHTGAENVRWGLTEASIDWVLRKGRKGKTFVFLASMYSHHRFHGLYYENSLNDMLFIFPFLVQFRERFPTLPSKKSKEYTAIEAQQGQQHEQEYMVLLMRVRDRVILSRHP